MQEILFCVIQLSYLTTKDFFFFLIHIIREFYEILWLQIIRKQQKKLDKMINHVLKISKTTL